MFEIERLPNGVTLLFEQVPYVRSAALGIFVDCGSRQETPETNGASHFLEHIVFKGTATRSALALAEEMDRIGGHVNAFTSRETTCFYARALTEHLEAAADVLCDLFFAPRIDPRDVATERGVILEELGMCEDDPEDLAASRLSRRIYGDGSLGLPILGTRTSLRGLTAEKLRAFRRQHYRASGTVVSLSGRFPERVRDWLRVRFSAMEDPAQTAVAPSVYRPVWTVKQKDTAQNQLCICYPGLPAADDRQKPLQVLNMILGGGASSRLYQTVRETLGLCYSIYSYSGSWQTTGLLSLCTAVNPAMEDRALAAIRDEVARLLQDGPTQDEVDRAREQAKASVVMVMEGIQSRMNYMARSYQTYGRIPDLDELVAQYDAVTRDEMLQLARELMRPEAMSFSALGQVRRPAHYRRMLDA